MCRKNDCRKKNYRLVRNLAVQFATMIDTGVRFYYQDVRGIRYYDFEPEFLNDHLETTLEIFTP